MSELGEALKAILAKVGDFFDIFDLSFFVSGAVCLGALAWWNHLGGFFDVALGDGYQVVGVALGCYVLGLICFAGGRAARPRVAAFRAAFADALDRHGVAAEYARYLAAPADLDRLYSRLWAEARQRAPLEASFSLLKRYWVMAATYDGLATALAVWALVVAAWTLRLGTTVAPPHVGVCVAALVVIALGILACRREAGRLAWHQMEELVATLATVEKTARAAEVVQFPKSG